MKLLRDFRCHACGLMQERFIDTEVNEVPCGCGGVAIRIIGMPHVSLEGITGAFPGAHERWAKIREDKARQDRSKSR